LAIGLVSKIKDQKQTNLKSFKTIFERLILHLRYKPGSKNDTKIFMLLLTFTGEMFFAEIASKLEVP
jgi:hypothetical protein